MTAADLLDLPIVAQPLQGRVALVTGGATGIGAAISKALAAAGASVAVNHLAQTTDVGAVLGDVRREGRHGIEINADLTDPNAVATMNSQVESELGTVDILVNNAGAYPRTAWEQTDEIEWARAIEVNLTIHYRVCRAVTPGMAARRWGRIVNIGSINARAGRPGLTAYSSAKAGLLGLTRSLARELGPDGICVNTVLPGGHPGRRREGPARSPPGRAEGPDPAAVRPAPRPARGRRGGGGLPRRPVRVVHHRAVIAHRRGMAPPLNTPINRTGSRLKAVIERVRAVLITPDNTLLLIKRIRPGIPPYWVIPGGKVEPTDAGREDALLREIREEIAGEGEILSLLHTMETADERQLFYLAKVRTWSFEDRTGPEFSQEGRGQYLLEEIALTTDALDAVDLKPEEIAAVLRDTLERGELLSLV